MDYNYQPSSGAEEHPLPHGGEVSDGGGLPADAPLAELEEVEVAPLRDSAPQTGSPGQEESHPPEAYLMDKLRIAERALTQLHEERNAAQRAAAEANARVQVMQEKLSNMADERNILLRYARLALRARDHNHRAYTAARALVSRGALAFTWMVLRNRALTLVPTHPMDEISNELRNMERKHARTLHSPLTRTSM